MLRHAEALLIKESHPSRCKFIRLLKQESTGESPLSHFSLLPPQLPSFPPCSSSFPSSCLPHLNPSHMTFPFFSPPAIHKTHTQTHRFPSAPLMCCCFSLWFDDSKLQTAERSCIPSLYTPSPNQLRAPLSSLSHSQTHTHSLRLAQNTPYTQRYTAVTLL